MFMGAAELPSGEDVGLLFRAGLFSARTFLCNCIYGGVVLQRDS